MTNPGQKTASWIKCGIGLMLAIISRLVAIAAIYVPQKQSSNQFKKQLRIQKSQFDEQNRIQQLLFDEERKEDVAISIAPNLGSYVKITKHKVLQMPWIIEIVNNGEVTTSITRWDVSKGSGPE